MMQKISFCTSSMNRAHHIKQTLKKNILDNVEYGNLEFVLLDYGSSDGLENYIQLELQEFIDSGILKYFRIKDVQFFNPSHSRNISFKVSNGNLLCNVDADNFLGKGFATFINNNFMQHPNCFLSAMHSDSDVLGRICVKRSDFFKLKGFDERMIGYGFEDFDLIYRLEASGLRNIDIKDLNFLKIIKHSNSERILNKKIRHTIRQLLVRQVNYYSSELFFLLDHGYMEYGTIMDNVAICATNCVLAEMNQKPLYEYSLLEQEWQAGNWTQSGTMLHLSLSGDKTILLNDHLQFYNCQKSHSYFKVCSGTELMEEGLFFYNQLTNRSKMQTNKSRNPEDVNPTGYGEGIVFKNFNYQYPINLK
ncbi:MAG: glycosyltransferase family 2 protein [Flavisolibacter sp.]